MWLWLVGRVLIGWPCVGHVLAMCWPFLSSRPITLGWSLVGCMLAVVDVTPVVSVWVFLVVGAIVRSSSCWCTNDINWEHKRKQKGLRQLRE